MSYSTLIKNFREAREMTHQQFGDAVGVSRAAVQQWERGVTAPTRKNQPVVAAFMGISVAELMAETTTYLLDPSAKASNPALASMLRAGRATELIDLENNPDYPAIRKVKFKLSAGVSGFAIDYDQEDHVPIVFNRQWYESRGLRPDRLFAVKVANGSMEPGLHHGDTVVVNTEATQPTDGVVFAVNYEGELCIKRLVRDEGAWWLSSDNPNKAAYPRKRMTEDCFIIGTIVHKQSEWI